VLSVIKKLANFLNVIMTKILNVLFNSCPNFENNLAVVEFLNKNFP